MFTFDHALLAMAY